MEYLVAKGVAIITTIYEKYQQTEINDSDINELCHEIYDLKPILKGLPVTAANVEPMLEALNEFLLKAEHLLWRVADMDGFKRWWTSDEIGKELKVIRRGISGCLNKLSAATAGIASGVAGDLRSLRERIDAWKIEQRESMHAVLQKLGQLEEHNLQLQQGIDRKSWELQEVMKLLYIVAQNVGVPLAQLEEQIDSTLKRPDVPHAEDLRLLQRLCNATLRDALQRLWINPDSIKIIKAVGEGASGMVHLATTDVHGDVAVKVLNLPFNVLGEGAGMEGLLESNDEDVKAIRRELSFVTQMPQQFDYVCRHLGVTVQMHKPAIVMEYCAQGSLDDEIKRLSKEGRTMGLQTALQYAVDVARGLEKVHLAGFILRDVKPANVLLRQMKGGGLRAVLADFGLALDLEGRTHRTMTKIQGTFRYMSPELFNTAGSKATPKADIWAFGATLVHMLTGKPPYPHIIVEHLVLVHHLTSQQPAPELPVEAQQCSPLKQLLEKCFSLDLAARPTAAELLRLVLKAKAWAEAAAARGADVASRDQDLRLDNTASDSGIDGLSSELQSMERDGSSTGTSNAEGQRVWSAHSDLGADKPAVTAGLVRFYTGDSWTGSIKASEMSSSAELEERMEDLYLGTLRLGLVPGLRPELQEKLAQMANVLAQEVDSVKGGQ